MTALSVSEHMKAKFDTAAKKMLNKRGAIRGAWPTASVTGNHARTYHHGIDSWLKSLLIFSTTKQANTDGRSIRLTELYALMRPIKHAYSGVRFSRTYFGSTGNHSARLWLSLRRQTIIFRSILPAWATSEMPLKLFASRGRSRFPSKVFVLGCSWKPASSLSWTPASSLRTWV